MIKACQKKILYIEGIESSAFDSAYFILRENIDSICLGGDDILKEADKIISERLPNAKKKKKRREQIKKAFLIIVSAASGVFVGGGAVALITILL